MAYMQKTVGQYLFEYLRNEGVTEIFGVPGDYNFSLLDILEHNPGINFVNCCNELNAGYAADGYARIRGLGAIITTFGVGELSACNAIAGACCESVPVVHIVGAPKAMDIKEHRKMHHTLLDGAFGTFQDIYRNLTVYTAFLTPENAAMEIPTAIIKARQMKKPVYLVMPIDTAPKPMLLRDFAPEPAVTSQSSLEEALKAIRPMLMDAQRPVIISDLFAYRCALRPLLEQLADKLNIPVVTMMMGKGSYDESRREFVGFYCGKIGSDTVRDIVEASDCVLAVGAVWDDYNTGVFTAALNPLRVIEVNLVSVRVGQAVYENIQMEDILNELIKSSSPKNAALPQAPHPYGEAIAPTDAALTAAYYYPRIQQMIREEDVLVAEAGTVAWGMNEVRLKKGVAYIAQGGWGCIGYATPAAFGAAVGAPGRRVLLFTGDGSLQLTVQELSSMLHMHCKIIVFVINNYGYTIEKYLNTPEYSAYNSIPNWNYAKLPETFGGDFFVAKAATEKEFDSAVLQAEEEVKTKLCLIEVSAPPMDAPEILHRMRGVLQQMQKRS